MKRQTRRGFTLVELLVVIAILAVLVAILLPSLANARRAAGRVACSSNMHQIALAISNYASNNKGKMPTTPVKPGDPPLPTGTMGSTFTPGGLTHPSQLGGLTSTGYIPKAHADNLVYDPGANGGEMQLAGLGSGDRAHYWWNPHPSGTDAPNPQINGGAALTYAWPNPNGKVLPRWSQMSQIPKGRILGCDVINTQGSTAHRGAGKSSNASWNLAYPDGHVSTVNSVDLYRRLEIKGALGTGAPYKGAVTNRWDMANDAIRVLELLDQGRDPKKMGLPGVTEGQYTWEANLTNLYYPPCTPGAPTEDVR